MRLKKNISHKAKPAAKKLTEGMNMYLLYCIFVSFDAVVLTKPLSHFQINV